MRCVAVLLAALWLGGCARPLPPEAPLRVVATEMQFAPSELQARQGAIVTITLDNQGKLAHNLLVELPSGTRQVAAEDGVDAVLTFPATDAGTFRFYCSIPGHEAMHGSLTIGPP
jgi:uncharacterized cupredoxin-like copper-binding protein